ncbi:hypothetical protein DVH24_019098 [Malus domestica]|uniref:Uncharacterized protein n=1 Tax=Malus domestica TaxID=3750 RepID=A0A498HZF5_MALDO|nr:hypothetical protein DVH24_019098 [Malus domestica]
MGFLGSSTIPLGLGMGGVVSEHCWEWGRKYLGYELCSVKDFMSLALGVISVLTWGVAEIPQIITNYKAKSTHGLSLAFLMTWILGDLFNLFGCLLEPATLPTQYYTAMGSKSNPAEVPGKASGRINVIDTPSAGNVSLITLFGTFNHRSVDLSVDNPNRGVVMQVGRRLLQIRKGNVDGLNPFMFIIAIVGNTTYIASSSDTGDAKT